MKGFNFGDIFQTEKKILNAIGIYPKITNKSQILLGVTCIVFTCLLELSFLILTFQFIKDLGTVIGALMLLVQQTALISKVCIFVHKRDKLRSLEEQLLEFSIYMDIPDFNLIEKNLMNVSKVGFMYRVNCVLCCAFLSIGPLIRGKFGFELPMPGYFPYDVTYGFRYTVSFMFQFSSLCLAAGLNTTVDILNCRLIMVASSFIEVLMRRLNKIGSGNSGDTGNEYDKMRECVKFHINILGFINGIEDIYSYIVFSQIAASVIVICSTAFQLISIPVGSGEFVGSLMYLINMITEVALYCWYGHIIQTLSENLGKACYMSKWYEVDVRTKKIIKIFMERANRPITLTAAKLFPLSLNTLKMILRSSYSYFAVLQRVYKR